MLSVVCLLSKFTYTSAYYYYNSSFLDAENDDIYPLYRVMTSKMLFLKTNTAIHFNFKSGGGESIAVVSPIYQV